MKHNLFLGNAERGGRDNRRGGWKRGAAVTLLGLLLAQAPAWANLCDSVKDTTTTAETQRDVDYYEHLFPDPSGEFRGHRRWNEIVLQCNRQRDTKGTEVAKITATLGTNADRKTLESKNLDARVIRGHYNFFGKIVSQLKYVYVLSKTDGVWNMVIPYNPIINDVVPERIDFDMDAGGHAWNLYDVSQIVDPAAKTLALKTDPKPIAETLCSTFTYFSGHEGKYDKQMGTNAHKRDKENKFISLGRIEYYYKNGDWLSVGCRVKRDREVYWIDADNKVRKAKADDWVLDNFVRTAEDYWTIPGVFELKLLMKGRNDQDFPNALRALLNDDDHLTARFATQFLPYGSNQMYKSNPIQFNNFSTMTTDGTYWHEVGHAFGLDDEYGGEDKEGVDKENSCENAQYKNFSPTTYQMCDAGADEKRTIYHYLAVSRYVTPQSECKQDPDCAAGEYCNKGVDLEKNQCVAKKTDNAACDLLNGDRQCKSGHCKAGRCYTPNAVNMGGTCYVDDACKEGKCSSAIAGTQGTCVCKEDADCGAGKYCNAGLLDLSKNQCLAKKADNDTCDIAGGDHQCASGHCKAGRCYTPNAVNMGDTCYVDDACKEGKCSSPIDGTKGTCVCKDDADCGKGKYCDGGFDTKINACRDKLNKGETCGKFGSVGNDHKCKSGECSGAPFYKCK